MRYFLTGFALLVVAVVAVAGFRGGLSRKPPLEVFPDMDRQQKIRPQEPNNFFANGSSSQLPVSGTIARTAPIQVGDQQVQRYEDSPVTTGRLTGTTNFVDVNPMPITAAKLARGAERYQISCSPCHGAQGDGKGIVSKYGWAAIANLHDKRIVALPDGDIFNTISHGKNTMGAYASNITVEDRWAIVAYLRALQLSRVATLDDVPADKRSLLQK